MKKLRSGALIALLSVSFAARSHAQAPQDKGGGLPPPPPVVPSEDPRVKGGVPEFRKDLLGKHPRVLFDRKDLAGLRAKLKTPLGRIVSEQFEAFRKACQVPNAPAFLRDATDGQRQGYWRMPTLALDYSLDPSAKTLEVGRSFLEMLLRLENWETGAELDSGMSAANIMVGAALCYDAFCDELEPEFREAVRQRLLLQARRMYYGGHLNRNGATGYWQGDPQNNHRWHRLAGLTLCVLAAYEGDPRDAWLLARTKEELEFVSEWLPTDGTSHEGPEYLIFGGSHLVLACHAADRLLGTDLLARPFFEHVGEFLTQAQTPDGLHNFPYGDGADGGLATGYANFLFRTAARHRQGDVQAAMEACWKRAPEAMDVSAWMALLWYDPSSKPTSPKRPTRGWFEDLGLLFVRDGWTDKSVGAMFKCGPFGGRRLNAYRNGQDFRYVNVAHDDPDANAFVLWKGGGLVAETDRYSQHKQSSDHNTILINGMGQMSKGRPEGGVYSQPAAGATDMCDMAYVTAAKLREDVVIVEGEAAGSYLATGDAKAGASRPDLDRFRRTFVWVEGKYLLVLDEIKAPTPVEITWTMQAPELTIDDADAQRYTMARDGARIPFAVASDRTWTGAVAPATADHRGVPLKWSQLRLSCNEKTARLASVYDLWGLGPLMLTFTKRGAAADIVVTGPLLDDRWSWTPARNGRTASEIHGTRKGRKLGGIGADDTE